MKPAEAYILSKPEPFKSVLLELQVLIAHTAPEAELLHKWNLPFYYLNGKMFCFLNFRKRFVDLSFVYGTDLNDPNGHLVAGEGRKRLRSLRYNRVEDIDAEVIIYFLEQLRLICKG